MKQKVCIIVLNYNGKDCLIDTLSSLRVLEYSEKRVIVVDNHSEDESLLLAQEKFPECEYIALEKNFGFAYGMNRGIEKALSYKETEAVWLFNYDAVADKKSLTELVKVSVAQENKSLLSPVILNEKGEHWFAGGKINQWRMRSEHITQKPKDAVRETGFLTGCALFIPRNIIQEIGLLDERYFLYYEDADYSERAKKKNIKRIVVRDASVIHLEKSSFNKKKTFYLVYSGLLFFETHKNTYFSLYQAIYGILRRLKNKGDLLLNRPSAKVVRAAYEQYDATRKSNDIAHIC